MQIDKILKGDSLEILKTLPDESVDCVVTSPPYWGLRDYGVKGQLGIEPDFRDYVNKIVDIFSEVRRVLKKTGTCWVNLGDTYSAQRWSDNPGTSFMAKGKNSKKNWVIEKKSGLPDKCLVQIPSRFAIAMTDQGWILRNKIIWHKPNSMPSSVTDRFTVDFEEIFLFVKSQKYYFKKQYEPYLKPMNRWGGENLKANGKSTWDHGTGQDTYRKRSMRQDPKGRNKRCVWNVTTRPFKDAHFAVFPPELIETPIDAGCPKGGLVLDPFMGAGTTGLVAKKLGMHYLGIELNSKYIKIAEKRLK